MAGQMIDSVAKSGKHFILKMYHNKFHYSEVMGILYLGIPDEGPSPEPSSSEGQYAIPESRQRGLHQSDLMPASQSLGF